MYQIRTTHILSVFCLLATLHHSQANNSRIRRSFNVDELPPYVKTPPKLTREPNREIAYQETKSVTLPCEAAGTPPIDFTWKKNERRLDLDGVLIRQDPNSGTLHMEAPGPDSEYDIEGVYQCFVSNKFGRAVSVKSLVKKAYIKSFEQKDPKVLTPRVGDYLSLTCSPPDSYPKALVFWGSGTGEHYQNVIQSKRVALDYEGNLHIANVVEEDEGEFTCQTKNIHLRQTSEGDDTKVFPRPIPGTPPYRAPSLVWSSEQSVIAIEGQMVKMMCIFSGYPTPDVEWIRIDGAQVPRTNYHSAGGLEMVISDVGSEHAGRYRCTATTSGSGARETRDFQLTVQYMPRWKDGVEPRDVTASDEEDAEVICAAEGDPRPDWSFTFDGIAESDRDHPENKRMRIEGDRVLFRNLTTEEDTQVIQCNVSNIHGYIFTNIYLNVLAEPPTFIESPLPVVKRAEGLEVILTCRVFAAPKAKITWKRGNPPVEVHGPRFQVLPEGDLRITSAVRGDANTYHCHAENKFGKKSKSGQLLIRERTRILHHPVSKTVVANTDVRFFCNATTDIDEMAKLKIEWRKNGEKIDYFKEGKISTDVRDNSLLITRARPEDTGSYTCVASNGIDDDESTAQLTVKDRPDPPTNIHLDACMSSAAQISWVPGSENNDEVIEFIVKYNTSFDPENTFHEGARVPKGLNNAQMSLSPWANYTFHVIARNSLGVSDRSSFTQAPCTTVAKKPTHDPDWVCTSSEEPDQLVIKWMTFPPIMHNGSDFHYILKYRLANNPTSATITTTINDWRQGEFKVGGQPTYTKYEISVKTANERGVSRGHDHWRPGFSGEDVPEVTPSNFELDENTLNATHAKFYWDAVDTSLESINGFFKGYRIVYWREDDPENRRFTEIIENEIPQCPPRGRETRSLTRYRRAITKDGTVGDLWPHSDISAAIQVMNGGKSGALSQPPIRFTTPQGVPGPVMMFRISEVGSHHMKVEWLPPLTPNGILTKYIVGYEEVGGNEGLVLTEAVEAGRHHKKIHNLHEQTTYEVFIWAYTIKGQGAFMRDEGRTRAAAVPDMPGIENFEVGDTWVNVSWTPSEDEQGNNPGSYFYVEYKPKGSDKWERTPVEKEHNWFNVTDLEPGSTDVRIVAVNGRGEETRSPIETVYVGPREAMVPSDAARAGVASSGWFIGLMCVLIFLLIILIIICLIRRNRGGKYPVHEKEKLAGRDPDKDDEEAAFGEYTKNDEPEKKKSFTSLNSEERPLESDTDSMAEYYNTDPSKFNEDGSFIGQYGGKKKAEPDATSPSALSTFV